MPENEFEKQVQQLFEELKLKPSAEVWPRVSSRIQNKRKHRPILFWIPFLALILGAGGYWLTQISNDNVSPQQVVETAARTENPDGKRVPAGDGAGSAPEKHGTAINEERSKDISFITKGVAAAGNNQHNDGSGSGSSASKGKDISLKPPVALQASGNTQKGVSSATGLPVPDHAGSVVAAPGTSNNQTAIVTAGKAGESISTGDGGSATPRYFAVKQTVVNPYRTLPALQTGGRLNPATKQPGTNKQVKLSPKKNWEWGVTVSTGVSASSNSLSELLGAGQSEKAVLNSFPADLNMSANIGFITGQNSLVAALPPPESAVKRGLGLQVGGFIKKKVSSRFALTSGLTYSYFSTNRLVGNNITSYRLMLDNTRNDVNASYSGYYSGGGMVNYTNRYHLLDLPLGVQWSINPSARLPLQVNGGISLAYLFYTNALHYHSQTGSYYKDKTLFNTLQAGLSLGASVQLFAGSRRPLYIGPAMQYNFNRLLKSSSTSPQHLVYGGLKAEWVMGKK